MIFSGSYPATRLRRLRQSAWTRDLVREHRLSPADFIWPIVVHDGTAPRVEVASMPGVARLSIPALVEAARQARDLGIPALAVFPNLDADQKNAEGTAAFDPNGLIPRAVAAVKDAVPEIGIMVDVALDPYTDHGHDGLLIDGRVPNDLTVARLVEQTLVQVRAGADVVAPSDMMDGRVAAIRAALEADGRHDTLILSYAAKFASAFYGPYRDAIGVTSLKGDKKTYQMDPANGDEALREVAQDLTEGADMVMVKPGMPYLDVCRRVADTFRVPTFAYQVSGEYAMIMAAVANGWMDQERAVMESLIAFKRAGCTGIVSYFAPWAAERL